MTAILSMTPVHMNRSIKTLREGGLAQFKQRSVNISDVGALADAGDFDDSYLHLRNGEKSPGEA